MFENLGSLLVTQGDIRNPYQITDMVDHVRNGGIFNQELLNDFAFLRGCEASGLIKIVMFEDGVPYLQDGHHRCMSVLMGGRNYLYPSEYLIENWKYSNYAGINWKTTWITPYDLKTQVRLHDLLVFRNKVLDIAKTEGNEAAEVFIRANPQLYKADRTIYTLDDLVQSYMERSNGTNNSSKGQLLPLAGG